MVWILGQPASFHLLSWDRNLSVWLYLIELQIMNNFYRHNKLHIKLQGTRYSEFQATRGIRQGCPLSPLIFAIASDSLLRIIERKMPLTHLRTFADDTAALLTSWRGHAKRLHTIMTTYSQVTTMEIKNKKPRRSHSGTRTSKTSRTT